jgi:hypothetical protein
MTDLSDFVPSAQAPLTDTKKTRKQTSSTKKSKSNKTRVDPSPNHNLPSTQTEDADTPLTKKKKSSMKQPKSCQNLKGSSGRIEWVETYADLPKKNAEYFQIFYRLDPFTRKKFEFAVNERSGLVGHLLPTRISEAQFKPDSVLQLHDSFYLFTPLDASDTRETITADVYRTKAWKRDFELCALDHFSWKFLSMALIDKFRTDKTAQLVVGGTALALGAAAGREAWRRKNKEMKQEEAFEIPITEAKLKQTLDEIPKWRVFRRRAIEEQLKQTQSQTRESAYSTYI